MNDVITVAWISAGASVLVGLLTFFGVIVTNRKSNDEMIKRMEVSQAVTDTKIAELTREVREHNNFARRMPVVENEILHIEHDIDHLKKFHEKGAKQQ